MTQGFTTLLLPFDLEKFEELAELLKKGYSKGKSKTMLKMGVSSELRDELKKRKPVSHRTIGKKLGAQIVAEAIKLEDEEDRKLWEWTNDSMLYDQFLVFLEKRDIDTFELTNQLAPIYENKSFPPYRVPFMAGGFQGYLSREEARRLLIMLEKESLAKRFENMEAHLPMKPELIHRTAPYSRMCELLRKHVMEGNDVLFWIDLDREKD